MKLPRDFGFNVYPGILFGVRSRNFDDILVHPNVPGAEVVINSQVTSLYIPFIELFTISSTLIKGEEYYEEFYDSFYGDK